MVIDVLRMFVCTCVCTYIYVFIYVCIYTNACASVHTQVRSSRTKEKLLFSPKKMVEKRKEIVQLPFLEKFSPLRKKEIKKLAPSRSNSSHHKPALYVDPLSNQIGNRKHRGYTNKSAAES